MAMSAKPGGGMSGKPGGGMGGGVGGAGGVDPNQTRNQNLFTTVGGLSRPGGVAAATPPLPRVRPSGPSGPPATAAVDRVAPPGGPRPRPALDPSLLNPLINGPGPQYPTNVAGSAGAVPEGMSQTQLDPGQNLVFNPVSGKMESPNRGPPRKRRPGSTDPADETFFRSIG